MHDASQRYRAAIDRLLRPAVTELEWTLLTRHGYVDDGDAGAANAVTEAVEFLRDIRQSQAPRAIRAVQRTSSGALQAEVPGPSLSDYSTVLAQSLSENIAAIASDDDDVVAFRTAHLPGGLLALADVEAWVSRQYEAQGGDNESYAIATGVPERSDWNEDDPVRITRILNVTSLQLRYAIPGAGWARTVSVAPGTVLDQLRRLAEGLAAAHGWEPAQAATFVLTGMTPLVALVRTTEGATNIRGGVWCAWSERIVLDVHPSVSAELVADVYRAARKRLDRERTDGTGRVRALSSRQLRVAGFVARREGTWVELMKEWNAGCPPKDRYTQVSNFRRDARLAQARVLYRGTRTLRPAAEASRHVV